jgi:hypothetical protein
LKATTSCEIIPLLLVGVIRAARWFCEDGSGSVLVMHKWMFMVVVACLAVLGCEEQFDSGSNGVIGTPPINVTGTWRGTWVQHRGRKLSGGVEFVLTQVGNEVTGTSTFTTTPTVPPRAPCFDTGLFEAFLVRITLSDGLLRLPPVPPDTVSSSRMIGSLDVVGNRMVGSYRLVKQPCNNGQGNIEVFRVTEP